MSEKITISAQSVEVHIVKYGIKAVMTIDDMRETIRNIAAVMPGDEWHKLISEINGCDHINMEKALKRILGTEVYQKFPSGDCSFEELARDVYQKRIIYLREIAGSALMNEINGEE